MLRQLCAAGARGKLSGKLVAVGARAAVGWGGAGGWGGGGRRWFAEGALSEEDEHEIMFFSLRHAATVTLKEMHQFGSQVCWSWFSNVVCMLQFRPA